MKKIIEVIKKRWALISYLFFGACTTVINIATYYLCYNIANIENVTSTIIAWIAAVLFAFITNKLFVFFSKSFDRKVFLSELVSFLGFRALTGVFEVGFMYVTVTVMLLNSTLCKLASNIIVIILNYIVSKLFIFKNKNK